MRRFISSFNGSMMEIRLITRETEVKSVLLPLVSGTEALPLSLTEDYPQCPVEASCSVTLNPTELMHAAGLTPGKTWEIRVAVSGSRDNPVCLSKLTVENKAETLDLGRLFLCSYAWVNLEITLSTYEPNKKEKSSAYFTSGWISLILSESQKEAGKRLRADIEFFNSHIGRFMQGNQKVSGFLGDTEGSERDPLAFRVRLLKKILNAYELGVTLFRTNPQRTLVTTVSVDSFERLENVTPQTLQYIVQHPEELKSTAPGQGIFMYGQFFLPDRTLVQRQSKSLDTTENRAVLSFLSLVIRETDSMKLQLTRLLENRKKAGEKNSAGVFVRSVYQKVSDTVQSIGTISHELIRLQTVYRRLLPVAETLMTELPRPSQIFLNIPQYRQIYDLMVSWFRANTQKALSEQLVFNAIHGTRLYELYVLAKILTEIETSGYTLNDAYSYQYPLPSHSRFSPYKGNNTFVFTKKSDPDVSYVTVWYEPVIYSGLMNDAGSNHLGLIRTSSCSFTGGQMQNAGSDCYYTPDYVIAINRNGHTDYLIGDAKFSRVSKVTESIPFLIYRYLFSIGVLNMKDRLTGLQLFCGIPESSSGSLHGNLQNLTGNRPTGQNCHIGILSEPSEVSQRKTDLCRNDPMKVLQSLL